ncbi:hypothetical protein FQR65_LT19203 [Abscondita terminalis]|nr:hypothetical protein FQR65_LT19203 [Abscondita terminalis]
MFFIQLHVRQLPVQKSNMPRKLTLKTKSRGDRRTLPKTNNQDSTDVVEVAPEQTTLTDVDNIVPDQSRKRNPKRKRTPSSLPTRRSKRLESVVSSVGVLQSEESSNTAPVHAEQNRKLT